MPIDSLVARFGRPLTVTLAPHNTPAPCRRFRVSKVALLMIAGILFQGCAEDERPPAASTNLHPGAELADISATLGLQLHTLTWGGAAADINGDGLTDLVIVGHRPRPEGLFLNTGEGFARHELGEPADRHDCAVGDVNQDGRADIYCTVGARRGKGSGNNNLYVQNSDGTFEDRAESYGVQDSYGRGRWTTFLNANGDAFPDLFVGNTPGRSDNKTSTNRLYINEQGKRFRSGTDYGVDAAEDARCVSARDVDGDGFDELLVCTSRGLVLYDNVDGRRYVDASARIVSNRHWGRGEFADIDGDGLPDLLTLNHQRINVLRQAQGKFEEILLDAPLEGGRLLATGDIDGDGDEDIFVAQSSCGEVGEADDTSGNFVLLNNGAGSFIRLVAPPAQGGCPSDVLALDVDGDTTMEFLVLNGKGRQRGYVQLIELQSPSPATY